MNTTSLLAGIAAVLFLALAGAVALWLAEKRKSHALAIQLAGAGTSDDLRARALEQANIVADALLKRADETFHSREQLAQARIEAQLKPVAETLAKVQEQVLAVELARAKDTGGLKEQITALMDASAATQNEARKLSAALRRGAGVQGRWGEQTLRNVLEMAGLQNRFDFDEQASTETEEGRRRPDVVVKMPGGGVLVIDAKCSLNAFLDAQDLTEEAGREAAYVRHGESVRAHMKGLAAKGYQNQFSTSPDLVAMFVPGDGFLAAALERQPELLNEGMQNKVIIVTPTTLFALCKAVAYGWRVEENAKGADQIAALGRELYKRISVMGEHAARMGRALDQAVGGYNAFVGSLESQVMSQAKKFEDLTAHHEGKALPDLAPLETAVRPLAKLANSVIEDPAAKTRLS